MPEMSLYGWFHTIMGIVALLTGLYSLIKYKVINSQNTSAKIFLISTLIAAVTALTLYKQGGFGVGHILAVLTLLALMVGRINEKGLFFGWLAPYFQAICYTSLFLFHSIPAITDGLRRLPVGDPVITTFDDPLLMSFYAAFLLIYFVVLVLQMLWIKRNT
ncbi:MAG: hypothetical protein OSB34_08030 [Planktomarina sp.]|jgi:hypothetical protein|nr:hypothetical protein [Planktomarina sp.]|tara:strand:- start:5977 stop:6459 length:483 start_codon:yes stop_codon:yes gene_type:complete